MDYFQGVYGLFNFGAKHFFKVFFPILFLDKTRQKKASIKYWCLNL